MAAGVHLRQNFFQVQQSDRGSRRIFRFLVNVAPQVLLEFLESKGVDAPFSCREGNCSSCACIVLEGELEMKHNDVLDAEDLADGIRLTCQALPLTELLKISYNG